MPPWRIYSPANRACPPMSPMSTWRSSPACCALCCAASGGDHGGCPVPRAGSPVLGTGGPRPGRRPPQSHLVRRQYQIEPIGLAGGHIDRPCDHADQMALHALRYAAPAAPTIQNTDGAPLGQRTAPELHLADPVDTLTCCAGRILGDAEDPGIGEQCTGALGHRAHIVSG